MMTLLIMVMPELSCSCPTRSLYWYLDFCDKLTTQITETQGIICHLLAPFLIYGESGKYFTVQIFFKVYGDCYYIVSCVISNFHHYPPSPVTTSTHRKLTSPTLPYFSVQCLSKFSASANLIRSLIRASKASLERVLMYVGTSGLAELAAGIVFSFVIRPTPSSPPTAHIPTHTPLRHSIFIYCRGRLKRMAVKWSWKRC